MFNLKMNGDLQELKYYLSRKIERGDQDIDFLFVEGVTSGSFDFELVKFYLDKIEEFYPNTKFNYTIEYQMNDSQILNTEKCKQLQNIDDLFRDKFNKELRVSDDYSGYNFGFRDALKANRKLDDIANKIKNASDNGVALSSFEKYMLAYEYVTDFVYNEGGDVCHNETSHWIPVMNGDKIVCAGYSSLLKELCDRIFTQQEVVVLKQGLSVYDSKVKRIGEHANNLIYIKDEKYNVDGLFYCDPCWGSKKNDKKSYAFCCLPLSDVLHINDYKLLFARQNITDIYLKQFDQYLGNNSSLSKDIENYLNNQTFSEEFKCIKDENFAPLQYDRPKLNHDDKEKLYDLSDELENNFQNKFSGLMSNYKNIRMPKTITRDTIKKLGIETEWDILKSGDFNDEYFLQAVEKLAKAFSSQEIQEEVKQIDKVVTFSSNFSREMKKFYINERVTKLENDLLSEQEAEIVPLRERNAEKFLNMINSKTNSVIPMNAFINHFKFLGIKKGLEKEELKEFVEMKIKEQLRFCSKVFDTSNCKGCFSTQQVLKVNESDEKRQIK